LVLEFFGNVLIKRFYILNYFLSLTLSKQLLSLECWTITGLCSSCNLIQVWLSQSWILMGYHSQHAKSENVWHTKYFKINLLEKLNPTLVKSLFGEREF